MNTPQAPSMLQVQFILWLYYNEIIIIPNFLWETYTDATIATSGILHLSNAIYYILHTHMCWLYHSRWTWHQSNKATNMQLNNEYLSNSADHAYRDLHIYEVLSIHFD